MPVVRVSFTVTGVFGPMWSQGLTGHVGSVGHRVMMIVRFR
jgi:hypothetical protein